MNIGRIKGVCSTSCRYDSDGACSRCGGLDPERWIVAAWRVPSEAEEKHGKALAAFADVAVSLGLDPAILSLRAGGVSDSRLLADVGHVEGIWQPDSSEATCTCETTFLFSDQPIRARSHRCPVHGDAEHRPGSSVTGEAEQEVGSAASSEASVDPARVASATAGERKSVEAVEGPGLAHRAALPTPKSSDPSTNLPTEVPMLSIEEAQTILEVAEAYGLAQENFITLIDERAEGRSPDHEEVIETVQEFITTRAAFDSALLTYGRV